ncbi:helix-turn-helix transcriptional regulator [Dyadobacter sp. 676]|uniref:Helix-turn-helix transcriptional regulator n=1 Tax=Dyadobacter sp. 676 TaxID=3088362 RepID=A0AAU8FPU7_9BACT
MANFSRTIRAVRMMKGVKQAEIADLLEVRQQSVSKLENGKTRISRAVADKIARYLGFSNSAEMETFYEKYVNKSQAEIDTMDESAPRK